MTNVPKCPSARFTVSNLDLLDLRYDLDLEEDLERDRDL